MANWINFNVVGGVTASYDPALKVYWRSFVVA